MKVDVLKAAGFTLDITVDLTQVDVNVKREYFKRKIPTKTILTSI